MAIAARRASCITGPELTLRGAGTDASRGHNCLFAGPQLPARGISWCPNKEALLVELLVGISARLLAGAAEVADRADDPLAALNALIDFHLDFALGESDLIRIQDRDLGHLPATAKRQVRKAQRQYVEIWVKVLRELDDTLSEADARLMAHATFGLLNSTAHSIKPGAAPQSSRVVLRAMTVAALASTSAR